MDSVVAEDRERGVARAPTVRGARKVTPVPGLASGFSPNSPSGLVQTNDGVSLTFAIRPHLP